jgi:hypothetical protein
MRETVACPINRDSRGNPESRARKIFRALSA